MAGAILFNDVNLKWHKMVLAIKMNKKINRPIRGNEISIKKICEFTYLINITQCSLCGKCIAHLDDILKFCHEGTNVF